MTDWNPYDDPRKIAKESQEEREMLERELDRCFVYTFTSDTGKKVMEYLSKFTLDTASYIPGASTFDSTAYREGQNSLMREIKGRIKRSQEVR